METREAEDSDCYYVTVVVVVRELSCVNTSDDVNADLQPLDGSGANERETAGDAHSQTLESGGVAGDIGWRGRAEARSRFRR